MELHVSLVGRDELTVEIYRQLGHAILEGRLRAGERLPPSRELARRLSVSRNTVTLAYEQLADEGYLNARVGVGTFVSDKVEGSAGRVRPAGRALRPRQVWRTIPLPSGFERQAVGAANAPGLVLGYGAIPAERIAQGLRRLRHCFGGT
jgi:GntR family transcriptional regulator/MocR family aminotransferase